MRLDEECSKRAEAPGAGGLINGGGRHRPRLELSRNYGARIESLDVSQTAEKRMNWEWCLSAHDDAQRIMYVRATPAPPSSSSMLKMGCVRREGPVGWHGNFGSRNSGTSRTLDRAVTCSNVLVAESRFSSRLCQAPSQQSASPVGFSDGRHRKKASDRSRG